MIEIKVGDALEQLKLMPSGSVHCCVTSPPFWGLRDYSICQCASKAVGNGLRTEEWDGAIRGDSTGSRAPDVRGKKEPDPDCPICKGTGIIEDVKEHQLGLEKTPEEYVQHLVEVFREVKRVLRDDGTLWLNLGDCYAGGAGGYDNKYEKPELRDKQGGFIGVEGNNYRMKREWKKHPILKPKDLVGIPWRVAFALQGFIVLSVREWKLLWKAIDAGDTELLNRIRIAMKFWEQMDDMGWYLRSDIIWSKPNPMPESVTDRPTKSHEYIFLLTKSPRYFYDQEAIREKHQGIESTKAWNCAKNKAVGPQDRGGASQWERNDEMWIANPSGRNKRSVWTMNTKPFSGAHFAVFPHELPETCIKAGTSQKGCCPKCGAPWERIIERDNPSLWSKDDDWRGWPTDGPNANTTNPQTSKSLHRQKGGVYPSGKFLGWRPTCSCGLTDTIPCTVLDPFAGSGTTGMVAKKLGRSVILIELNPVYIDMVGIRTGIGVRSGPLDGFPDEKEEIAYR